MKNNGGSAFPAKEVTSTSFGLKTSFHLGMSLRDYFAAAALPGILATQTAHQSMELVVGIAYYAADCMLQEREKC